MVSLEQAIIGALKSCIDVHGPIDKTLLSSAAKRIVGAIRKNSPLKDYDYVVDKEFAGGVATLVDGRKVPIYGSDPYEEEK